MLAAKLDACGEEDCTGLHIWIDAHSIGGSVVRVSPDEARQMGFRLMEMADYLQDELGQGDND
jgi:DNA transposition AAA+ family ATPase